jgi:hypothetical protein
MCQRTYRFNMPPKHTRSLTEPHAGGAASSSDASPNSIVPLDPEAIAVTQGLQREHAFCIRRDAETAPLTNEELVTHDQEYTTTRNVYTRHTFVFARYGNSYIPGGCGECFQCGISAERFRRCPRRKDTGSEGNGNRVMPEEDPSRGNVAWVMTEHVFPKPKNQRDDTNCIYCQVSHRLLRYHRCPGTLDPASTMIQEHRAYEQDTTRRARSEDAAEETQN